MKAGWGTVCGFEFPKRDIHLKKIFNYLILKLNNMQREQFISELKVFEGFANFMYLDTNGYVTIGVGILLKDAQTAITYGLNFSDALSGKSATNDEVKEEWKRVKKLSKGRGLNYYRDNTKLRSDEGLLEAKFQELINSALLDARKFYPDFDKLPSNAQYALWDMSFNLGYPKLSKYQKLKEALQKGDYEKAINECNRHGIPATRNQTIRTWMQRAKDEAGDVEPSMNTTETALA